ncbi:transposase [bacterium]|nr:transposase [bacterium]
MARKPRIHFTGAVYHVMLRGNDGQTIFFDPKDYSSFEQLVAEGVERFQYQIHAYCWMPNHVHMVVEVTGIPLSKIIQNLSFRYTRWINKRENRIGHLFQGRYKAILIDVDNYLLELIRYIHLNPVRSNLANSLDDYRWSAHKAYLGKAKCDWLSTDWVLRRFNRKKSEARKAYQRFVLSGLDEKYRKEFHTGNKGGVVLGDDEFVIKIPEFGKLKCQINKLPLELAQLSEKVCIYFKVPESLLKDDNRIRLASKIRSIIALEFTGHSGSIRQVADYFGRDISTLSRQLANLKLKIMTDEYLQQEIQALRNYLTQ